MSHANAAQSNIEIALGLALLIGAAAMFLYFALDRRHGCTRQGVLHDLIVWPVATVIIGMIGGLIVRMSYSAAPQMQQSFSIAAATTTTTPTPSCTPVVSTTEMLTDPGFESNFSSLLARGVTTCGAVRR